MILRAWFIDHLHPSAGGGGCLLKWTGTGLTSPESASLEMIWPKLPVNKHLMILMQNELRSMLLIKTYREIYIFFYSAVDIWRLRVPSPQEKLVHWLVEPLIHHFVAGSSKRADELPLPKWGKHLLTESTRHNTDRHSLRIWWIRNRTASSHFYLNTHWGVTHNLTILWQLAVRKEIQISSTLAKGREPSSCGQSFPIGCQTLKYGSLYSSQKPEPPSFPLVCHTNVVISLVPFSMWART